MNTKKVDYSIGDTAEMTGVSQKQLRHWEGKYIPEPERVVCGERAYRRYTDDQIKLIKEIKRYRDQGFTLESASKMAHANIQTKKGGGENE